MLFLRFFWFLLWPLRLPFVLARRLFRVARSNRAGEAAVAGAGGAVASRAEEEDLRYSGLFQVLQVEKSDEPRIDEPGITADEQIKISDVMAAKAKQYYAFRPPLFPGFRRRGEGPAAQKAQAERSLGSDFYEEIENGLIEQITSIDNAGEEDQFIRVLRKGRCVANANARILFCELAPLVLFLALGAQAALMLTDPLQIMHAPANVGDIEAYLREGAAGLISAGVALGIGVLVVAFVYRFSYTHIQRQNAQDLNAFIQVEFSRLNDSFRVAHRECLRAETRIDNAQHEKVGPIASGWALAYHWIGVRQLLEELAIRNNMFQVRRNTALYVVLGVMLCLMLGAAMSALIAFGAGFLPVSIAPWVVALHLAGMTLGFVLIAYGVMMLRPFSIFASRLKPDEWNRFDTLAIGKAIAEQVSNDKLQIVIQRDTRR